MRGILPDAVIDRRKQGFAVPLGRWFRGQLGLSCATCCFPAPALAAASSPRATSEAHRSATSVDGRPGPPPVDADLVRALVPHVPRMGPPGVARAADDSMVVT